jgi:hypothetical protein
MPENKKFCNDCEVELTAENTEEFGGFDGSNYLSARQFGFAESTDFFTKCDSCFNADIDRAIG